MSASSSGDSNKTTRPQPSLLQPPATIISPPSPTDLKTEHPPVFASPPVSPSASSPRTSSPEITTSSPTSTSLPQVDSTPRPPPPRQPSHDRLRSPSPGSGSPYAADLLSTSPKFDGSLDLLRPDSPGGPSSSGGPTPGSPRSPSPSSPHYRPKSLHHRRTSSTHRVRETMDGHQRSTEDGQRMVNQYRIGESIGRGAYAKVEKGVDVGTGQEYAVKEFSKSRMHFQALQEKHRQNSRSRRRPRGSPAPDDEEGKRKAAAVGDEEGGRNGPWGGTRTVEDDPLGLIRREIAIMKKLDHPHIVHLYEAISVPNADALFLVLEYLPGGVLMDVHPGVPNHDAKPPFPLPQAREYFRQLCLGLEYLHHNGVVHRDIKPDNILLTADRESVKLCDFGVSEMFIAEGDDRIKKSGGSPAFLSPESFSTSITELHGKAVDIWALGVVLYCMVTGKLPWNVNNPIELFDVVRTQQPPIPDDWDEKLKELLNGMLDKNPQSRIQMDVIREHDWVTSGGDDPMIPTEENLYDIGKHVEEPTQEELGNAIGTLRSVFTVIRAAQKLRRLQLNRRSISHQGQGSNTASTGPSYASGSMDSYATQSTETADTSVEDDQRELVTSPESTTDDVRNPMDGLKINTDVDQTPKAGDDKGEETEMAMVESPVSEDEEQGTPISGNRS